LKKLIAIVLLTLLTACAGMTPRKTIASTSIVIEQIAIQADQLQKSGQIDNEREDYIMAQLRVYNDQLRTATALTGDAQMQSLKTINDELMALRTQLNRENK